MDRQIIDRFSDYNVKSIAPVDVDNDIPLNDAAGASSSFKVYDPAKDEELSLLEASGQTVLDVTNAGIFVVNDIIELKQDDATLHASAVNDVDIVNGQITIANPTTVDAQAGNRIRVVLDSSTAITQDEFGTANIDTEDWGYTGVFPDTHAAHNNPLTKTTGFDVDVEISFIGGAGLNRKKTECLTIKEDECE